MNQGHEVWIRADPQATALNDPVYHNENCPKLAQSNLKPGSYKRVGQPPDGYRPCQRCGG